MRHKQGSQMPENEIRTIVLHLLRGAVPERANELSSLFKKYQANVAIMPNETGMTMRANKDGIKFSLNDVDVIWLFSFSAGRAIETYAPSIVCAEIGGLEVGAVLQQDHGLGPVEQDYKARMSAAEAYATDPNSSSAQWPSDIPKVTSDRASLTNHDAAAFDLACLALASFFLHEIKHVEFANAANRPVVANEEEMACDTFARSFLTDKLAAYAEQNAHDYQQVLSKRAFGLAIGAISIHGMTPHFARWGNIEYPSIGDRIDALIGGTPLDDNAHFWLFAGCLLTGIMRRENRPLDLVPISYRKYAEGLVKQLK